MGHSKTTTTTAGGKTEKRKQKMKRSDKWASNQLGPWSSLTSHETRKKSKQASPQRSSAARILKPSGSVCFAQENKQHYSLLDLTGIAAFF